MDYRRELAARLRQVPFSLAEIARRAGVTRSWVSQAKAGKAHNLREETARRIHAAIDELVAEAAEGQRRIIHPGLEELARPEHAAVREALEISDDLIAQARMWVLTDSEGRSLMPSLKAAIRMLQAASESMAAASRRG